MKILAARCLVAAVLLSNAACARQSGEEARRDFILGGDHGWVDLALVPAAGAAFAKPCAIKLDMNGETMLVAGVEMPAQADAPPVGFRRPVPAGKLSMVLGASDCVEKPVSLRLPVDMTKDHLARLEVDGRTLQLKSLTPFEPTTLEWVRTEVLKLQAESGNADKAMAQLSLFAKASLGLNVLLLLTLIVGLFRRRL